MSTSINIHDSIMSTSITIHDSTSIIVHCSTSIAIHDSTSKSIHDSQLQWWIDIRCTPLYIELAPEASDLSSS